MEHRQRLALVFLIILWAVIWASVPSTARAPSPPSTPSGFLPVPTLVATGALGPQVTRPFEPTPTLKPTPKPAPVLQHSVTGKASWYCNYDDRAFVMSVCHYRYPDKAGRNDMYAAACAKLRAAMGPNWRGKTVTVTGNGTWVKVKLIDYCASKDKTIDLYRDAADVLGYSGVLRVKVSW